MSSATVFAPLERSRYFDDGDAAATSKRTEEIIELRYDWNDALKAGESVSSIAYADSGVTTSSPALAANISSCNVTGLGETTLTATLSTGRKLQRMFRYYPVDGCRTSDYR